MGYTIIAPVGDNPNALFIGMKEFPTEKVILISPVKYLKDAEKLRKRLDEFTIKSEIIEIGDNILEEMLKTFGMLTSVYKTDELIVNVATGDRMSMCASISASYANGLKAFDVSDSKPVLLPILKLSYYNELSDNKLKILKKLDATNFTSLKELNEKLGMSISLLSYHINGNYKYKGLKEFRLIDTKEENKNLYVKLSQMGSLLLKGYIKQKSPEDK